MSQKIHIHIEYDYEKAYKGGTVVNVINFYRVFITGLNKGDYGVNIKQRNFHTIDGSDQYRLTHSNLIRDIKNVMQRASDFKELEKFYQGSEKFTIDATISPDVYKNKIEPLLKQYDCLYPGLHYAVDMSPAQCKPYLLGGRRRRPSSRKYKKSAKRVFRKKSRSTRRR